VVLRCWQVVPRGLEARLQAFPPLRTKQLLVEGVLHAPVGTATIVFMNASSVPLLMGWDAEVTQAAIQVRALLAAPLWLACPKHFLTSSNCCRGVQAYAEGSWLLLLLLLLLLLTMLGDAVLDAVSAG
jgi:hypothetical protein